MPKQLALFENSISAPEGLRYAPDFVSPALERSLIAAIQTLPLRPFQFGQFEGKRRVASFGFSYDYALRQLQQAEPIPAWLAETIEKVEAFGGSSTQVRQVLCTEYDVGVGIGWHRDKPHFDTDIWAFSRLRLQISISSIRRQVMGALHARCRAALALSDDRGIASDVGTQHPGRWRRRRYSITFRTMRDEPDHPTPA